MKKGLFLGALVFLTGSLIAQDNVKSSISKGEAIIESARATGERNLDALTQYQKERFVASAQANKTAGGPVGQYVSFTSIVESINGSYLGNYALPVSPDSLMLLRYTNEDAHAGIHDIGMVYTPWWQGWQGAQFGGADMVTIDTVAIGGAYRMYKPSQTGDKLRVTIFNSDTPPGDTAFGFGLWPAGTFPNLSPQDTPYAATFKYKGSPNHGVQGTWGVSTTYTYEYTLTADDTTSANGLTYYYVPLGANGLTLPARNAIAINVQFIPSVLPALGDTVDLVNDKGNTNYWSSWTMLNSDQASNDAYFLEFFDQTITNSFVINYSSSRYGTNPPADQWRNLRMGMNPTAGHQMALYVSGNSTVGEAEYGQSVDYQLYPNPTNGDFTLRFGDVTEGDYTVRLMNIIGQEVHSEVISISSNEEVKFNLSGLESGMYLLNISGNGYNSAQKNYYQVR